ncbi:hypothetical protein N7540_012598 [Penicillium herquei]|nr:hypothetical protein N7540_012598 [Penicillium herquei]
MSDPYSIPEPGNRESYEMTDIDLPVNRLTPEIAEGDAGQNVRNQDDFQLRRLGKIPSLQRNFDAISLVGLTCIVLVTWEVMVM